MSDVETRGFWYFNFPETSPPVRVYNVPLGTSLILSSDNDPLQISQSPSENSDNDAMQTLQLPSENSNNNVQTLQSPPVRVYNIPLESSPTLSSDNDLLQILQSPPGSSDDDTSSGVSSNQQLRKMDIEECDNFAPTPAIKYYSLEGIRLKSFALWPMLLKELIDPMVLCGFFYTGTGDRVQCFFCGIAVDRWVADDDIWGEHLKYSPQCLYAQSTQKKFIIAEPDKLPSSNTFDVVENKLHECPICSALTDTMYAFIPCGHVVCLICESKSKDCFTCRHRKTTAMRIYL
ncbi:unnamed protein product [Ceutorhynchus assimilis]|uniref:RING-type domain-containing protein n=1 Tax=Ceutorhynchus assimilis TaxID=467358 RepID=A0A9N9N215_9CUCU|nr:unnamed protein product [Ceutorhynchus assimilis]